MVDAGTGARWPDRTEGGRQKPSAHLLRQCHGTTRNLLTLGSEKCEIDLPALSVTSQNLILSFPGQLAQLIGDYPRDDLEPTVGRGDQKAFRIKLVAKGNNADQQSADQCEVEEDEKDYLQIE